ncbi:peptidylprolyl isomerase [Chondrinema litorale]|uniref:peptidylprolyl isomerase n=1 Tax=Chondrinema litorale TaxID=2994555 RepID=UPI002543E5EE|nr:peptidylprolyl isomerase [Chondrinema litorale]UZR92889.1 peptidylprolyl isomerase [Chondrinema litorale]
MTYKIYLLGILCLLLVGCSEGGDKDDSGNSKDKSEKEKVKKQKKVEDNTVLTDKNVVSFLTEYAKENPEDQVIMKTSLGDIKIKLYENTPLHRANFIRLAKKDFYDNTLFYRVIKGFVVQGGGSDDLAHGRKKRKIGKYNIPAEFKSGNIHKKGALAAARNYENNPDKKSNPFDFYFVHGQQYDKLTLDAMADEKGITFSEKQKTAYLNIGGAPHLDGEHTVFGEVIEGLDIIDEIASKEVGEGDWPVENVYIESIEIVK